MRTRINFAHRQWKMKFHLIVASPFSADIQIAITDFSGSIKRLPVDRHAQVFHISRDMNGKCKEFVDLRGHMVGHASLPRVCALHADVRLAERRLLSQKQMGVHRRLVLIPRIFSKGGHHADQVRRAACARIPARTLRNHMFVTENLAGHTRIDLQRIDVEKPLSVELHTADDAIVERPLHHIGISSVLLRL